MEKNTTQLITDEIYKKIGNSRVKADTIGNYASLVDGILAVLENKKLYNRGVKKIIKLKEGKISFKNFKKIKQKESKKFTELMEKYDDNNEKIVEEFEKFINKK